MVANPDRTLFWDNFRISSHTSGTAGCMFPKSSVSGLAIIHSFSQSDLIPGDRYSLMFSAYSPSQNADCAAQRRDLICQFYLDTVSICFPNRAVQYFIG